MISDSYQRRIVRVIDDVVYFSDDSVARLQFEYFLQKRRSCMRATFG